ncbi:MAG: serine hydrolase [Chitinophagales bacterium]
MKRLIHCSFPVFVFSIMQSAAQTIPETIDELLNAYAKQNFFNGAALVAKRGSILINKGYQWPDRMQEQKADSNTIFQIGSLTKQFTAAAILQLADKKIFSLQDRLSKYLPDYPNGDSIMIENLMNHSSGIPDYVNDTVFMREHAGGNIGLDGLIGSFKFKPLLFKPGTKNIYSNSNYILLGSIIEKAAGKSYFQVISENIFRPIHMSHSGFDFQSLNSNRKAKDYLRASGNSLDSTLSYAAASIYSSTSDLYRWDRALYGSGILSDSMLALMYTQHHSNYGYGWFVDSSSGRKVVMDQGSLAGFVSFIARIPSEEICIILLDNGPCPALAKIGEEINDIIHDQPFSWPLARVEIAVDPRILREYVGQYQIEPNFIITIMMENGHLNVQTTSQLKLELHAEREDFFFVRMLDIQIAFVRDDKGKVTKLTLSQSGMELEADRIGIP